MPRGHTVLEQRIQDGDVYEAITRYGSTYYLFSVNGGTWTKKRTGKTPERF